MTEARSSAPPHPAEATGNLVDTERLWLAREVHDIVGYLTVVVLHANLAAESGRGTSQIAESLQEISEASWKAARELQALLAVLRRVDGGETAPGG